MTQPSSYLDPGCRYVHSNRFGTRAHHLVKEHVHITWQAELVVRGRITAHVGQHDIGAAQGDTLLLPPHIPHSFSYHDGGAEVFSVKFSAARVTHPDQPRFIASSLRTERIWANLQEHHQEYARLAPLTSSMLSSLLDVLLLYSLPEPLQASRQEESPFVRDVRRRIDEAGGTQVTVRQLARALSCSEQYVRRQFTRETGTPLKTYIDRSRAACIEQYIAHSDLTLKQVAYHFGFSDPQGFSRFVRRMLGSSPRTVRRGMKASNQVT